MTNDEVTDIQTSFDSVSDKLMELYEELRQFRAKLVGLRFEAMRTESKKSITEESNG